MDGMYGEFDRPAGEPVVGGLDAQGRTFLEVALEEMEIEADTLALFGGTVTV